MERLSHAPKYEILKTRDFVYYKNNFEYTPPGWVNLDGMWYPMGYRLVRQDLSSLKLRNNPTPLQYKIGEWVMLPKNELIAQMVDRGGIFSSASRSSSRKTEQSCQTRMKEPFNPRIFYAALYNPIAANSYAVKSQGLMLLEEII